jgi:predicted nucleic acid-binding protein
MPLLKFLADTNAISAAIREEPAVTAWFDEHVDQVGVSTITLAEMRRGVELKRDTKTGRVLEREFRMVLEDYRGAIFAFDEGAAAEWGRLMRESHEHNRPLAFEDSFISAIARSMGMKVLTQNWRDFPGSISVDPFTGQERPGWRV